MQTRLIFRTAVLPSILLILSSFSTATAKEKEARRPSVSIQSLKFEPKSIDIKAGETVVWTNNDDRDYSVDAKDGSFSSGNLRSGQTYEHKFTAAGKFEYGCSYHPRMSGVVIVSEK